MNISSTSLNKLPILQYEVHLDKDTANSLKKDYFYDYEFRQVQSRVQGMECYIVTDIASIFGESNPDKYIGLLLQSFDPPYLIRLLGKNSKGNHKYLRSSLHPKYFSYEYPLKQPYHTLKKTVR